MKKNNYYYCTFDTETWGGVICPKGVYNLSGFIHDRKGKIIAPFNYLIAEYFEEINKDSYSKKNFHRYLEMIERGEITMVNTEEEAIQAVKNLCDFYNVRYIMAYNTGFDLCKTKCKKLIENREFIDIYLMALQTIGTYKKYEKFCIENKLMSKSNGKKIAKTAESMYAYLTNNPNYKEEHTALEDSKIEMQIFLGCLKTHKKFTKNTHAWDMFHKK